jgi:hypothetical protein
MDRFDSLSSEYFDGTLEPREAAELAEMLRQDPERKRRFLEMYEQNGLLAVDLGPPHEEALARKVLAEIEEGGPPAVLRPVLGSGRGGAGGRGLRVKPPSRRGVSWKTWAAASAAVLVLGWGYFLLSSPDPGTPAQPARLESAQGEVTVRGPTGPRRTIRAGEEVLPGQILETAGGSSVALLSYPDRTRLEVSGNASIRFQPDPLAPPGKMLLVSQGVLRASVAKQPPDLPFVIQSRWAETRVLGTKFELSVDLDSTRLAVAEGRVRFASAPDAKSPGGKSVEVGSGEQAAANSGGIVRWKQVCDLDFSRMKALPAELEPLFSSSRVLHTPQRKIESAPERIRFEKGGLVFDPAPGPNRDHGLVVARWKEAVGDDLILEAEVAGGPTWSLGFAVSGDSFEGYRVIFGVHDPEGGITVDTIYPTEFIQLAKDGRPIAFGKPHLLRAELRGKHLKVWVDAELHIDTVINHPLPEGRRRRVALSNFGESPVVRTLRVWKAESP